MRYWFNVKGEKKREGACMLVKQLTFTQKVTNHVSYWSHKQIWEITRYEVSKILIEEALMDCDVVIVVSNASMVA